MRAWPRNPHLEQLRTAGLRGRIADFLGLERNVFLASAAIFILGLGEELWKKFLPKYLEALGASTGVIGLFGTAEDFFDAIYQYPGGWMADRLGRRRAFLIFVALAAVGYIVTCSALPGPLYSWVSDWQWRGKAWPRPGSLP